MPRPRTHTHTLAAVSSVTHSKRSHSHTDTVAFQRFTHLATQRNSGTSPSPGLVKTTSHSHRRQNKGLTAVWQVDSCQWVRARVTWPPRMNLQVFCLKQTQTNKQQSPFECSLSGTSSKEGSNNQTFFVCNMHVIDHGAPVFGLKCFYFFGNYRLLRKDDNHSTGSQKKNNETEQRCWRWASKNID